MVQISTNHAYVSRAVQWEIIGYDRDFNIQWEATIKAFISSQKFIVIVNIFWSTSNKHQVDVKVSTWCLIPVDPMVFAIRPDLGNGAFWKSNGNYFGMVNHSKLYTVLIFQTI